ncbi:MAG: hypothetical protein GVY19_01930 [Bacteroidetes bacterium]|jgi:alpha-L-fucosidase|nr:hypothetical protein [Bacteroidota bacterium]
MKSIHSGIASTFSVCFMVCMSISYVHAQFRNENAGKNIAKDARASSQGESVAGFQKNTRPCAQWFPRAGLGLFIHWSIHSLAGIQPSWAMIKDYPYVDNRDYDTPEKYYKLAPQFNPKNYDPDKWMKAAAGAGFTYVVLTTKHHDGYCLWPSEYGRYSTRTFMNGRDLLKSYVDACRKYNLNVGFYFSPRDWSYPNYPMNYVSFNHNNRGRDDLIPENIKNEQAYDAFYQYTKGQLEELLTNYGTIDILWFDGIRWPGVDNLRTGETIEWVRTLQPGIIINERWGKKYGDFYTEEWVMPEAPPPYEWWEYTISWKGHWGYSPHLPYQFNNNQIIERLVDVRKWGGNFLLNFGPAPDGTMPDEFYQRLDSLENWMRKHKKSVIHTSPLLFPGNCNKPATRNNREWFVFLMPEDDGRVEIQQVSEPAKI